MRIDFFALQPNNKKRIIELKRKRENEMLYCLQPFTTRQRIM